MEPKLHAALERAAARGQASITMLDQATPLAVFAVADGVREESHEIVNARDQCLKTTQEQQPVEKSRTDIRWSRGADHHRQRKTRAAEAGFVAKYHYGTSQPVIAAPSAFIEHEGSPARVRAAGGRHPR